MCFGLHQWGFPYIRGAFLGVPVIRIIIYWGLYWGTLILGNSQYAKFRPFIEPACKYLSGVDCYERWQLG